MVDTDTLQQQVSSHTFQEIQNIFKFLIRSEPTIKQSAYPRFTLEMTLLQASQMKSFLSFDTTLQTIDELGEKFSYFKNIQPKMRGPQQNIEKDGRHLQGGAHLSNEKDGRHLQGGAHLSNGEQNIIKKAVEIFQGEVV
jgi:DNA polymerase III gamma/tau subunit